MLDARQYGGISIGRIDTDTSRYRISTAAPAETLGARETNASAQMPRAPRGTAVLEGTHRTTGLRHGVRLSRPRREKFARGQRGGICPRQFALRMSLVVQACGTAVVHGRRGANPRLRSRGRFSSSGRDPGPGQGRFRIAPQGGSNSIFQKKVRHGSTPTSKYAGVPLVPRSWGGIIRLAQSITICCIESIASNRMISLNRLH